MNIDLGCGNNKKEGFTGIDMIDDPAVDIHADIDKEGIPLGDNEVDHLYTSHFLEHTKNLGFIIQEISRVCKNGATVEIKVPHFKHLPFEEHLREFKHDSLKNYEYDNKHPGYPKFLECQERKLIIRNKILNKIFVKHPTLFEKMYPFRTETEIYMRFKVKK